ncbi:hypothetical protein GE09DRAFT_100262 [Coniochaeta sp. 2T2.1]|nr:hypothetical protein GE09DRAFT_100262 [Coniochaeta sp. 2T2.1]
MDAWPVCWSLCWVDLLLPAGLLGLFCNNCPSCVALPASSWQKRLTLTEYYPGNLNVQPGQAVARLDLLYLPRSNGGLPMYSRTRLTAFGCCLLSRCDDG